MSTPVETLREAARHIRRDYSVEVIGGEHGITAPAMRAVADWLDVTARGLDPDRLSLSENGPYATKALAVARAYLGETP